MSDRKDKMLNKLAKDIETGRLRFPEHDDYFEFDYTAKCIDISFLIKEGFIPKPCITEIIISTATKISSEDVEENE